MLAYLIDADASYRYMGTLTIGDDILDGPQFKAAQDRFFTWYLRKMRSLCTPGEAKRQSIFWFLEFQARGAPHLHFFYTEPVYWKVVSSKWCDCIDQPWCFETAIRLERLREGRSGIISYAAKYAAKQEQKELPDGVEGFGRWWGIRGYRASQGAAYEIEINPDNVNRVVAIMKDVDDACKTADDLGEAKVISWKTGGGRLCFTTKLARDGFLAPSGWRTRVEIDLAKLVMAGASRTADELILECE